MESQNGRHGRDERLSARATQSGGATLLWVIAALVMLGSLAAGVASMSPSALMDKLAGERASAAYYASVSGLNYSKNIVALAESGALGYGWDITNLNGTYSLGNNTSFVLSATGSGSPYQVASRGIVQSGSANEANYQAISAVSYAAPTPPPPPFTPRLGDYNFNNPSNRPDYAKYADNQTRDFPAGLDKHDITTKNFTVGKDYNYGFGNIWFTGDREGISSLGVSNFAKGFRLFFTFMFTTNIGDGFVVAVLNASNNNYGSCGGDSAEGGLLGYAGDSRVYDSATGLWSTKIAEYVDESGLGKGLKPPKFGVEIDLHVNTPSHGTWNPDTVGCRADDDLMNELTGSGSGPHIGFDFWGNDSPYRGKTCNGPGTGFSGNLNRFSDVRHGSGFNAPNTKSLLNDALQYLSFSIEKNVTYYYRMDVIPSGNNYTIKTWVSTCGKNPTQQCKNQIYGTNSSSHTGSLSDTKKDFSAGNDYVNNITSIIYVTDTLELTTAQKSQFSNFMWGITSGSGAYTQQIDFRNIGLSLRQ